MTIELEDALPETRLGRLGEANSLTRRPIIGAAGDSIANAMMGNSNDNNTTSSALSGVSPLFWALLDTDADVLIDGRSYADGGYNFAIGGTTTAQMVAAQIPQLETRVGDLLFIQSGTNNGFVAMADVDAAVADIASTTQAALAAGWGLVAIVGMPPSNGAAGAGRPRVVEHFNRSLANFANATRGVRFLDVTPLVRDLGFADSTKVPFRGVPGELGACSDDGTHYSAEGARAQNASGMFSELLARFARKRVPRAAYDGAYDGSVSSSTNGWGASGLFLEGGGSHNGSPSADVAVGFSISDAAGITVTPELTTDPEGWPAQKLSFSGTSTDSDPWSPTISLQLAAYVDPHPAGDYELEAVLHADALVSAGIGIRTWKGTSILALTTGGRLSPLTQRLFLAGRRPAQMTAGAMGGATIEINFENGMVASGSLTISRLGLWRV